MSDYSNEQLLKDEMLVCNLADFFDIFGDTSRIKILLALHDKSLPVSSIAELTDFPLQLYPSSFATSRKARGKS